MDKIFWLVRWEENRIGFHLDEVNAHLTYFWPRLGLSGGKVFVPLCGKSLDLLWLRAQGHEVLGVEISPVAVRDFFADNRLQPERRQQGPFERWSVDGLSILQGDFFDLTPADLTGVTCVYDRASLIALPPAMRTDYAGKLTAVLPTALPLLLVTLEYDQSTMNGPPFSVNEDEVRSIYRSSHEVELLLDMDALADDPGMAARGLSALREKVYRVWPERRHG